MKVGFIGLGNMGAGMARSLIKAGHEVTVWNRSPEPVLALLEEGAARAVDPAGALQGDAAFTMLADDHAVRTVVLESGALDHAAKDLVHIMSATISVRFSQALAAAHARAGVAYVCAPVLGRPDMAASGQLNVLAAGDPSAIERVTPLLEAVGQKVWPLGDQPHLANVAKLACNFTLASAMEAMAEAFALARRYEMDPHRLSDLFTGTLFAAPAYKVYGPVIAAQRFEPVGFKLPLGLKDIRLVLEAGEAVGAPLPFASVLRDNFVDAIGHGDGEKDWSAVSAVAARRAGL